MSSADNILQNFRPDLTQTIYHSDVITENNSNKLISEKKNSRKKTADNTSMQKYQVLKELIMYFLQVVM